MGLLAGLIGAGLAILPAIEEATLTLTPVHAAGASFERYSVVSVPIPGKAPEHSLFRLRVAASHVWLDGARLGPNEDGDFDLLNLHPKRPSRVTVPGWVKQALLIETPRVFVSRYEIGDRSTRLWVRNSLENTVNVFATVTGANGAAREQSATVPPGSTQVLELLPAPGLTFVSAATAPWSIVLEKQEEAMEGGYRFMKIVTESAGPTVNTSVNR